MVSEMLVRLLTWTTLLWLCEARFASINVSVAMTVSEDPHRLTEDMVRVCAQLTDLSLDELHRFGRHDFANASEATQCFAHCVYEQMGLVRDGVFVQRDFVGTLDASADPGRLLRERHLERRCHGIRGANQCETAFRIHRCRHELGLELDAAASTPEPEPQPRPTTEGAPQE